jgi:transcriptional regulator with XRE-family HTH domain
MPKRLKKTTPRSTTQKQGTLGWLEEIYFSNGTESARNQFKDEFPEAISPPYSVVKLDGQPTQRTDVVESEDGISYESFSPPAFWEVPYTLLRATFKYVPKEFYIYHSGEEILIPTSGEINYHFFGNEEGERPRAYDLKPALKVGNIIAVNPQAPHHTWGGRNGGQAWMLIRHISDTPTAITLTAPASKEKQHSNPRRIDLDKLEMAGIYALVAWGISERIRLYRERANCRISELADLCGIDPSHASRIENAEINTSLGTLEKIAKVLNIDLNDIIAPQPWSHRVAQLPRPKNRKQLSQSAICLVPKGVRHHLHPNYWEVPAGQPYNLRESGNTQTGSTSSWIVLEGQVIFEILIDKEKSLHLLEAGQVLHVKGATVNTMQTLQYSKVIQVSYSQDFCSCYPEEK